jgi:hypothetical protein
MSGSLRRPLVRGDQRREASRVHERHRGHVDDDVGVKIDKTCVQVGRGCQVQFAFRPDNQARRTGGDLNGEGLGCDRHSRLRKVWMDR